MGSAVRSDMGTRLSIVMPCLNEEKTLALCIADAKSYISNAGISAEIVVADNGSEDNSRSIAEQLGARVVSVPAKGYGAALRAGIEGAQGEYVIMGDSDHSYDFRHLEGFVKALDDGNDLVNGNRFRGGIDPGAMPFLHKYFGNPFFSYLGRIFFGCPFGDMNCGLRGFRREKVRGLDLQCTGMEFAVEMLIKSTYSGLKVTEVPTVLRRDGRDRPPHLRTWRDGWRTLRFMLIFAPNWLFLFPGIALTLLGSCLMLFLARGPIDFGRVVLDIRALLLSGLFLLIGFQSICFSLFSKMFAIGEGFIAPSNALNRLFRIVNLERGLLIGSALLLFGVFQVFQTVDSWTRLGFPPVQSLETVRTLVVACTTCALGFEIVLASFFMSVLGVRRKSSRL